LPKPVSATVLPIRRIYFTPKYSQSVAICAQQQGGDDAQENTKKTSRTKKVPRTLWGVDCGCSSRIIAKIDAGRARVLSSTISK
jgi:hypothetical protein